MVIGVVKEADDEDGQAFPVQQRCFQSWIDPARSEALAGGGGYPIGQRVLEFLTNEFEEELVMEEKISLGFEKLLKLHNVIDLVNTNSKHDKNNEKLDLYDKFKTLLSSESFLSGLNQVNSFSLNF